jgi:hypothetical protein
MIVFLCLALFAQTPQALARDGEPPLDSGASVAVSMGLEISRGDYGAGADATLVTLPVNIYFYPLERLDITLEVPLLSLSSRSDSGIVVTHTGGAGRGRNAGNASKSTAASTTSSTVNESGIGDVNMTAGWNLLQESESYPHVRPFVYVKAPTGDPDSGLGTGTFEAGPGLSFSKWFGRVQLFGEAAYIFQDSETDYPGRNYVRYLGGFGVQVADRWVVSLLAKGSSARSEGADPQSEGRLKVNFLQSRRISWDIYGLVGFTDASPDIGGGVTLSYRF